MIKVLYFLEDRAQELFITSIVTRVASEESVAVEHTVRSASHGSGSLKDFKAFVKAIKENPTTFNFDLLVVAVDGNCKGHTKRSQEVKKKVSGSGFEDRLICCIPDPHIERWYLLDIHALKTAVKIPINVNLPPYKCKKDFYKECLGNALRPVGALLSGPDYAEKIVQNISFKTLEDQNAGFKDFISELRRKMHLFRKRLLRNYV